MLKILLHVMITEDIIQLVDTGIRITSAGERKFRAAAEQLGEPYKPMMLDSIVKAIHDISRDPEFDALKLIASELLENSIDLFESVQAVYPTSRTSWGTGLWTEPLVDEDTGEFLETYTEYTSVRYRIQRYSNGYCQYEIEKPDATLLTDAPSLSVIGHECREGNIVYIDTVTDSEGMEGRVSFEITDEVVR